MAAVEVSKETLDVALMLGGGFVVGFLEFGVPDEGFAMFAPVLGLSNESVELKWFREG